MSGISSGIGLISGIDTASLIEQLIAIEQRPVETLRERVQKIDVVRAAFIELSAKILAAQNSIANFGRSSFFNTFNSTSSNDSIFTAAVDEKATPGTYTFRVNSLVSNHSVISRGFADANITPVGVGTISLEVGNGRIDRSTELGLLNGGAGVRRGTITITDRSGASADIDLSTTLTVDDVLEAINSSTAVNIRARVTSMAYNGAEGDRIVIEDLTPAELVTGNLSVADRAGGSTAADLGISGSVAAARLDGRDIIRLASSTPLSVLNDGNGVGRFRQGDDLNFSTTYGNFTVSLTDVLEVSTDLRALNSGTGVRLGVVRLTDRNGASADVDLSGARTAQDVLDALRRAVSDAALGLSVTIVNSHFQITDTTDASGDSAEKLKIEDVTGHAAADLGIAGEVDESAIIGRDIYRVSTVGDLVRAINLAEGNNSLVEATISADGDGIVLRALGFDNTVTVTAGRDGSGNVSTAAGDLGLLDATFDSDSSFRSRRLLAGLNTVLLQSLNGGRGVDAGTVRFTDRSGAQATLDFSDAQTLQEVIERINAAPGTSFVASVNSAGNGIILRDESGGSQSQLIIEDLTGSLAADLGIAVANTPDHPFSGDEINGGNLQLQYISRQTSLAELNGGKGVEPGTISITDSAGALHTVNVTASMKTVGQVIDAINIVVPDTVVARINDTGDGIVVIDNTGGSGVLAIEDTAGSQTAANLRLAGTAGSGDNFVDGSFEIRIDVAGGDTLADIAKKVNEAGSGFTAAILNDGSSVSPYSLTITSEVSGRRGELTIDTGTLDFGFGTLSKARDAIVTLKNEASSRPVLISSRTNTLDGVVEGVTLNLLSAADEDVTLSITQDIDGIAERIGAFTERYNDILDTIEEKTSFDADTLERGPLLGDSTVNTIRSRMSRVILQKFAGVPEAVSRLFSVGVRLASGGRLEFDEEQFREVYERSPELVEKLFTREDTGLAAVLQDTLDELTRDFDGLIARKDDLLANQQEILNDRIDGMNTLIDAKRTRLETQFVGLEIALASLQAQQNSLATLAQLASGGV